MNEADRHYYRVRLTEERERALKAASPEASAIHRALAEMYQRQLENISRRPLARHG